MATVLASHAALALAGAQLHERDLETVAQLREALTARDLIGQAGVSSACALDLRPDRRTLPSARSAPRFAAHIGSCEDADAAGADEETDDDENDAEQNLPSKRGDDAGDDQDHGENPQQSGHETLQRLSDRRGGEPRFT